MRAQGRGTRRRLYIAAVAVLAAGLFGVAVNGSAATSVPTLEVTTGSGGAVRVRWDFASDANRRDRVLEIERGPDTSHFSLWMTVDAPERRSHRFDRNPLPGRSAYRVRVLVKGVPGPWSAPAAPDGGPAPTAAPPTTTVKPTTTTVRAIPTTVGPTGTTVKPTTTTVKPTTTTKPKPTTTTKPKPTTTTTVPQVYCVNGVDTMFQLINDQRQKAGKKPLVMAVKLTKAAQAHNRWMSKYGTVGHGDARSPNKWIEEIRAEGYGGWSLGQNLAAGNGSAAGAFGAWMNSPGHKANILGDYKHVGIACRDQPGTPWRIYWTVNFGLW